MALMSHLQKLNKSILANLFQVTEKELFSRIKSGLTSNEMLKTLSICAEGGAS